MNITLFLLCTIPFFVTSTLHLIGAISPSRGLQDKTKPLLIPLLIAASLAYVLFNNSGFSTPKILLILALFCGWLGDVFLLGANVPQSSLIKGILAFMAGHAVYIFILCTNFVFGSLHPLFIILIALVYLLCIFLVWSINKKPSGILGIGIIAYALILGISNFLALIIILSSKGNIPVQLILYFGGSFFFLVSDSILSITLFVKRFRQCDFAVMSTYLIAQTLLTIGISFL